MRTMLLSFNPYWYEKIKSGEKIYEYRTNFPNEDIKAYMYISSPYKKIVGYIYLGKRIPLEQWKKEYSQNPEVQKRIVSFMERRKYVMPIKSYHHTESIELETIRESFPKFVSPQMYYYLDTRPELLKYIELNAKELSVLENNFDIVDANQICKKNYN